MYGGATPPLQLNGVLGGASALSLGGAYGCAIQSGSSGVYCWGADGAGQATPPALVAGLSSGRAEAIAAGDTHSLAIETVPEPDVALCCLATLAVVAAMRRRWRQA